MINIIITEIFTMGHINNKEIDISFMFYGCTSLKSLPDISKWDISNIKNISGLFGSCASLTSLPDLSKWNTTNVKNMRDLFNSCKSLQKLPDISIWDTSNVENIDNLFSYCNSLCSLPDISKWEPQNLKSYRDIFLGLNTILLPDIYKWKINVSKSILNSEVTSSSKFSLSKKNFTISTDLSNQEDDNCQKKEKKLYKDNDNYFDNNKETNYEYYENFYK